MVPRDVSSGSRLLGSPSVRITSLGPIACLDSHMRMCMLFAVEIRGEPLFSSTVDDEFGGGHSSHLRASQAGPGRLAPLSSQTWPSCLT